VSSSAYIQLDNGVEPISRSVWLAFCDEQGIEYRPQVAGRNVFYKGAVEICFGELVEGDLPLLPNGRCDFSKAEPPEEAYHVSCSTYYGGGDMPELARLAALIWHRFNGRLSASPEISALLVPAPPEPETHSDVEIEFGARGRPSSLAERL
jgi:hypothetical protein